MDSFLSMGSCWPAGDSSQVIAGSRNRFVRCWLHLLMA